MDLHEKLEILAGAARYDVSCASSGTPREPTRQGFGTTVPSGVCHTFTEDGRCVSLLKVLFTNFCVFDCAYCANRASNDIPRASFTTGELVDLTIQFYQRNYIEGLFLSSGVLKSPDDTMERLIRVARTLRLNHGFRGYIHLKCIPGTSSALVREAGLLADRLSVNIELPSEGSLRHLAPDKCYAWILGPMESIRDAILRHQDQRRTIRSSPLFAPAGQSTQLIVGATPERDYEILDLARKLYRSHHLKRVYYSAFIPVRRQDPRLPALQKPPLRRENRLYQSDWLMRLYGFQLEELLTPDRPDLDLTVDPKLAYAKRHPELFPVDLNRADYEEILRVPGIGLQSAKRIIAWRRERRIRLEHLHEIGLVVKRAMPFVCCAGMGGPTSRSADPEVANAYGKPSPAGGGHPSSPPPKLRNILIHDGTFDGLLTGVFQSYELGFQPDVVLRQGHFQCGLFDRCIHVISDPEKADRVWKRLFQMMGRRFPFILLCAFLSARNHADLEIFHAIRGAVRRQRGETDNGLADRMRKLESMSWEVRREAHRMKGFVRFRKVTDDAQIALIAPKHNVLPLILDHFEKRFRDRKWMIVDTSRGYGYRFDTEVSHEVRIPPQLIEEAERSALLSEPYRDLWKQYYEAVNVPQRGNAALHLKMVPRRYWKYLPEKTGKKS